MERDAPAPSRASSRCGPSWPSRSWRGTEGRIVDLKGDGAIIEFGSAVAAVEAAVEIQRAVAEREAGVPEAERIRCRNGINLGDVVVDGDTIHGDGVNMAARIEGLSEPGGVQLSRSVHNQVKGKLD